MKHFLCQALLMAGCMLGLTLVAGECAALQAPAEPKKNEHHSPGGNIPYDKQKNDERQLLEHILRSESWHYRVLGLFRLERFTGEQVHDSIKILLADPAWQVRCFAIRTAVRKDVPIPDETFAQETDPRVIRMAQRFGVALPEDTVKKTADRALRSRVPEQIVLGIEIASRSGDEKLEAKAKKRLGQMLQQMNTAVLVSVGDRLAKLLAIQPAPQTLRSWESYLERHGHGLSFPEFEPLNDAAKAEPMPPIADVNNVGFQLIIDYFDGLIQQDLELMVAIDGTGSMGGVITQAQSQTNRLMLTFNDLAKSMRMGFVIFRTHTDRPMLQGRPLTHKIGQLRDFLFGIEAKGGGPKPEAIVEALDSMGNAGWKSGSSQQVMIIADEPAQTQTLPDIRKQCQYLRSRGIPVHTVVAGNLPGAEDSFKGIAEWGGGVSVKLSESNDLGRVIIRLLVQEEAQPSFEHLYDLYIELGL